MKEAYREKPVFPVSLSAHGWKGKIWHLIEIFSFGTDL